jgi:hypothetical protein
MTKEEKHYQNRCMYEKRAQMRTAGLEIAAVCPTATVLEMEQSGKADGGWQLALYGAKASSITPTEATFLQQLLVTMLDHPSTLREIQDAV